MLDAFDQANQEESILGRSFGLDHGMMVSPDKELKSLFMRMKEESE